MDLTEAVHAQNLIDWLTNPHATTAAQCDAARDGAAQLAEAAHQVTHAGPTADQVLAGWDNLLEGCSGCPDCTPNPHDQGDELTADDETGGQCGAALSEQDVRELVAQGWLAPVPVGSVGGAGVARACAGVDAGGGR